MREAASTLTNSEILVELIAHSEPELRRQAARHATISSDAEEALQSAYALFLERYEGPAEPLPWLLTTVKREAWRIARHAYRHREVGISAVPRADGKGVIDLSDAFPDPQGDTAELSERSELHRTRRQLIEKLKPDERTALLLLGLGCSYLEIAELRGWTRTKVNRCIAEGREALRARSRPRICGS